jgi:hypothetical protein
MINERKKRTSRDCLISSYLSLSSEDLSSPFRPFDHEHISSFGASLDSMSDSNYEILNDLLKNIRSYIQNCEFNTIFDVLNAEIQILTVQKFDHVSRQQRELRK